MAWRKTFEYGLTKVGRRNATKGASARWAPKRNARHVRKMGTQTQHKTRPQVGRPNATQGEFARWPPKRKTHPQRKRPHKGALGKKMSWRMDKNKFWLGVRLFNTASPRLDAPTQCKARPQYGCPNTTQGDFARWSPKRKTHPQRKRPHKGALG